MNLLAEGMENDWKQQVLALLLGGLLMVRSEPLCPSPITITELGLCMNTRVFFQPTHRMDS